MQWSSFQENIFSFVENNTQSAVINAVAGSGKGGWVESVIPTPSGNRRFGDLEVGDEWKYTRAGITYRFKIIQKSAYSETSVGLFVYILSSMIETLETW